jgi:hypothetical protein
MPLETGGGGPPDNKYLYWIGITIMLIGPLSLFAYIVYDTLKH